MKRTKRTHDLSQLQVAPPPPRAQEPPACPASPVSVATPVSAAVPPLKHATSFKRKRSDSDAAFSMLDMCLDLEWALQTGKEEALPLDDTEQALTI